MKGIGVLLFFFLAICNFAFAQSSFPTLEKVKQLKLLESTRDDILEILSNDIFLPHDASYHYERFFAEDAIIGVSYSSGKCSEESEDWKIPEWKVTEISISPKDFINIKDVGIDYSKFRKERLHNDYKKLYVYYDKKAGVAILAYGNRVESVMFSPSEKDFPKLCDKPEVKEYYSNKRWLRDPEMKNATYHNFPPASVVGLDLSQDEIIIRCDAVNTTQDKNCADSNKKIYISTTVVNPMNDVLSYDYRISGGKLVGQGAKVVWDLSGVRAGTYKITAIADSGCGPCGKWMTKTVVVKECTNCSRK